MIRVDARTAGVAVVVSAVVAYATALGNGFAYDDVPIIRDAARVHTLTQPGAIWLAPYWQSIESAGLYRPAVLTGYALQWALGGGGAWLFHAISVGMHAAVSMLLYALLRTWFAPAPALIGALVFVVHPVHVEAVANLVGQAELIAAGGVLIALVLLARRPDTRRLEAWRVLLICGALAVALLAKEHAIAAPALLPVVELARARTRENRVWTLSRASTLSLAAGVSLVVVAYLGARAAVLGGLTSDAMAPTLPFLESGARLTSALRLWPEYARLLFWPARLSSDYSPAVILPAESWTPMAVFGGALLAVTALAALLLPRRPHVGLPAAWFLITVLPVSNLIVPIGVLLAERTLYLPSAAVAFVTAGLAGALPGLPAFAHRHTRRAALAAVAGVLLLAALHSARRAPVWTSTQTVNDALIRDRPESYRAQWTAAVRALQRDDHGAAERHWTLAYRLWPHDPHMLAELAMYRQQRGDMAAALELIAEAQARASHSPRVQLTAGFIYLSGGSVEKAERALHAACAAGDTAIDRVAAALASSVRRSDIAAACTADAP
ncbi:MAG: hypothetical protein ACRELD_03630 [Longimicrobiales bacterium]